jgi:diketogulonate reductase-like aldo/keto reductase
MSVMTGTRIRTMKLPSGREIPVLGQGTWRMGESSAARGEEVAALRYGLDLGLTLIDTAEMYGEGGAEEVVGRAIEGRREEVFLVSKVYPHNATRQGAIEACKRSLRRLKTDYLDLYLLHWRGSVPLDETLEAFQALQETGAIRHYGVSNFDLGDMLEVRALPGGREIAANQVLYSLLKRGIESDLLPWCRRRGIPIMAYSPLENSGREQKKLLGHAILRRIAVRHDATPAQVALAWVLHQKVVAIPKAVNPMHIRDNRAAHDLKLTKDDLGDLDLAFPLPPGKSPLAMR